HTTSLLAANSTILNTPTQHTSEKRKVKFAGITYIPERPRDYPSRSCKNGTTERQLGRLMTELRRDTKRI
ncbi:hypothetical protein Bhyg_08746, partial [Pseudolycoriella hygida]